MKKILLLLALLGVGGTAWAADDTPQIPAINNTDDRTRLFHGKVAYERGKFDEARKEFEGTMSVDQMPTIYYNLGLCNEGLGDVQAAITAYSSFVAALPKHPQVPEALQRIAALKKIAALLKDGQMGTPTLKKPSKALLLATSLSLAGLAVGTGVAGGVLEYSVGAGIAEIPGKCTGFCEEYKTPLRMQRDAATGLFAVAGAAGAAAVVTGVLYHVLGNQVPSILISSSLTNSAASISLGGTF